MRFRVLNCVRGVLAGGLWLAGVAHGGDAVQFNRDVLPILSGNCFQCHGPDANTRKREIRFDTQEGLFGSTLDGAPLLVPGKPLESELFVRITHPDVVDRMPPAESKLTITDGDIETLKRWIEQGAAWQGHWAFIPPEMPGLPEVSDTTWCRNEIDYFILEQLDAAGLSPSAEADKETLIRRVSLDLTGLPPTPGEVEAFLEDTSSDAYEKVVDRLLASPHYGERMAFPWLDAARYADTNGYQRDTWRIMWPWRDWVIQAFNENMPYDEFTIEQLAGDLLPNATRAQKIATGFNRNHRINGEGGIIAEEYAVEYVADRVSTTSTAFMGLTMGCARCHDHKFDPFSQKEFYELFAFFNRVPEEGKGREEGNDVPYLEVPEPEQAARKASLTGSLEALEALLTGPDSRLDPLQAAWEEELGRKFSSLDWQTADYVSAASVNGAEFARQEDGSLLVSGPNPEHEDYLVTFEAPRAIGSIKLDVLRDASLPQSGPGRSENGNLVLSEFEVERVRAGAEEPRKTVSVAEAFADYAQSNGDFAVRNAIDGDAATGWATGSFEKRENRTAIFVLNDADGIEAGDLVTIRLRHESPYGMHALGRFRVSHSASREVAAWTKHDLGTWHYLGLVPSDQDTNTLLHAVHPAEEGYDAQRAYGDAGLQWVDKPEWADGNAISFGTKDPGTHYLHRTIRVAVPMSLTLSLGSNDAIKVWMDGRERLANNVGRTLAPDQEQLTLFLEEGTHDLLIKVVNYGGESGYYFRLVEDGGQGLLAMMQLLSSPASERDPVSQKRLTTLFREGDAEWRAARAEAESVRNELEALKKSIVTTMVMEDMAEPRDTYLLKRGEYDKPDTSEKLEPSTPSVLGEMDEALPRNRLGFAQWLVDPAHPLTARVRVNHYWQMYFGRGLVKTSEDFGTQGQAPTHPELLDWLARNFIETGWDVKAMQKQIVMSATYRQSSVVPALAAERDPGNRLLSHMPRVRLAAEMIRDQALAVSGLLTARIGGPSVKPYQPEGMWSSLTFQNMDEYDTNFYEQDTGDKIYRRGLYTFWKRTILPPRMQIFNAAGREMCSMRQENTNTPMQALAVMNDPTFVEAARFLGERMVAEGGDRSLDRLRYGFRLVLAHAPNARKEQVLLGALNDYQSHYIHHEDAARELLGVGDTRSNPEVPESELAAYTMLASVLLNMDEAITRE